MAAPNQPTLLYPNGREKILARVVDIEWKESAPVSNDGTAGWYEIFYAEDYNHTEEPDWKMIASVPIGSTKFSWKVGNLFKSRNVRVAIRAVNARGERSPMSVSADNFTLLKSLPNSPSVISPVPGHRYGKSIQIVFDDSAVKDSASQRAKYYVYFRSTKAGIPLSVVAQKVPIGTGPLEWDTSLLPPSDDYVVTVYMADDDGNKSSEVNITDIQIMSEGFFLIDTMPPSAYIQINDGNEFTRDKDVVVRLFAYDETTGAHSFQFVEGPANGPAEAPAEMKFWTLSAEDGNKVLKANFQDYGANRIADIVRSFRYGLNIDNADIADMTLQRRSSQDIIWVAVNSVPPAIYKMDPNSSFAVRVNENVHAIAVFNKVLYISVDTGDGTAFVYRFTGVDLSEAISLEDPDSEILSLESYKSNLYLGASSGKLYAYDELTVNEVRSFDAPIERMFTDSTLLYILLRNRNSIIVYDGLEFREVEL